jgi:hypothetical protein
MQKAGIMIFRQMNSKSSKLMVSITNIKYITSIGWKGK